MVSRIFMLVRILLVEVLVVLLLVIGQRLLEIRRHEYNQGASVGTPGTLTANLYFGINLARFRRTFDPGVTDDVDPTRS